MMALNSGQEPKYWTFISYSHADTAWATWIQRKIEQFRVPRTLVGRQTRVGTIPRRLFPAFRDREELASSGDLNEEIDQALRNSQSLIVICSPHSAASEWVNAEVTAFQKLGRGNRVLCLIVDGEPNAAPGSGLAEALPPALRGRQVAGAAACAEPVPLAADARKNRDGKNAKLKLLAGVLDVGFDELRRRDRRRRLWSSGRISVGVVIVISIVAAGWWNRQQAVEQRTRLANARQIAASSSIGRTGAELRDAALLAVESLQQARTVEGATAWATVMDLLPERVGSFQTEGSIAALAISPNGERVAAAIADNVQRDTAEKMGSRAVSVKIWDALAPREIAGLSVPGWVRVLSFDINGGRLVIVSDDSPNILIIDAATGNTLHRLLSKSSVSSAEFGPDGKYLAAVQSDGVQIWEAATGRDIVTLRSAKKDSKIFIAFAPNGHTLAVFADGIMRVWDIAAAREVLHFSSEIDIGSMAFAPDGQRLAITNGKGSAEIRDSGGRKVRSWPIPENWGGSYTRFNHDGTAILTVGERGARLWQATTGTELGRGVSFVRGEQNVAGFVANVPTDATAISPDGEKVAAAMGTAVRVWDLNAGAERLRIPHNSFLGAISFSANGQLLATGDQDGTVAVWHANAGRASVLGQSTQANGTAFSPDGSVVAVARDDGTVDLWSSPTVTPLASLAHPSKVYSMIFAPNSQLLATSGALRSSDGGLVTLWDIKNRTKIVMLKHEHWVQSMAFQDGGRTFVTVSSDRLRGWKLDEPSAPTEFKPAPSSTVSRGTRGTPVILLQDNQSYPSGTRLYDLSSGIAIDLHTTPEYRVDNWALSPDGSVIITSSGAGARLWHRENGEQFAELPHEKQVTQLAFSRDGKYIATLSTDTAIIWEASQGRKKLAFAHPGILQQVFNRDSGYLATADANTVRIWDIESGEELSRLVLPSNTELRTLTFSPDGRYVGTASGDGARLWLWRTHDLINAICSRVDRNFNENEWRQNFGEAPRRQTCHSLP